ncbi:MAG: alpha/beta hydrolase [Clostridia bacterium]|nr:alpha/beta hydrolase [Clostridia bacterium]
MAKTTIQNNPALNGLIDLKHNIVFAAPGGEELALQLLKPMWQSEGGKGFPLVVFIQGSAWTKPNQFWQLPQLSLLARRGYVIASVTHRSCWTDPAPAFLRDVKTAIRFLRANAAEYDIDPERVCAWGTSSGGNTALLLGLTDGDKRFDTEDYAGQSSSVKAVVDCFGPTDLVKMIDNQYGAQPRNEENLLWALAGRDENTYQHVLKMISPISYVVPGRELPPFLILHGDADDVVLFEDSEALYDKLSQNGYEADLIRVSGAPHEGDFWSEELLEIAFSFIQKNV